jgi:putative transposase
MARKERRNNSKLRQLMQEYGVRVMEDMHNFVKMPTVGTIQTALDTEFKSELSYSKYDYKNKDTDNSRNGYSHKTVQGSLGELEITIPRDRKGEFEPIYACRAGQGAANGHGSFA